MLVHRRVTTQQHVAGTHLYTWVKRDKGEESSLSKKTTRRARPEPRTSRSGVYRSATHTPPQLVTGPYRNYFILEKLNSPVSLVVCCHISAVFRAYFPLACVAWRFCRAGRRSGVAARKLLPPQSPRGFSALACLYYLARPTKTAMLRRLIFRAIVDKIDR